MNGSSIRRVKKFCGSQTPKLLGEELIDFLDDAYHVNFIQYFLFSLLTVFTLAGNFDG